MAPSPSVGSAIISIDSGPSNKQVLLSFALLFAFAPDPTVFSATTVYSPTISSIPDVSNDSGKSNSVYFSYLTSSISSCDPVAGINIPSST